MNHRVFKAADAHKLEDPQRLVWLPPADILHALHLAPGAKVADIGAGTGYFSIPLANAVGTRGHVFAVDLQPEMLQLLRQKLDSPEAPTNISLHQGDASGTTLQAASVNLVFLANVWHEIDDLDSAFQEAARITADRGRIAILDWRADCPPPPGPPADHRIPAAAALDFLSRNGCLQSRQQEIGPYSYLVTAEMPGFTTPPPGF